MGTKRVALHQDLEDLRCERGWTYDRLAEAVTAGVMFNIKGQTMRMYCMGKTKPRRTTLFAVRKFVEAARGLRLDQENTPAA